VSFQWHGTIYRATIADSTTLVDDQHHQQFANALEWHAFLRKTHGSALPNVSLTAHEQARNNAHPNFSSQPTSSAQPLFSPYHTAPSPEEGLPPPVLRPTSPGATYRARSNAFYEGYDEPDYDDDTSDAFSPALSTLLDSILFPLALQKAVGLHKISTSSDW